ncbi:MAG: hypothetical protein KC502_12550 [Myxococcales bacterium]|nr:hypothetical protein [Myxococcales bacterium]
MKQQADQRPDPSYLRKAAIAAGRAADHAGSVDIEQIPNFDIDRTIFSTLEGAAARFVVKTRVGTEPKWHPDAAERVQRAYVAAREKHPLPEVSSELLQFMVEECDFDVEHADGSFLDHLYFCYEYNVHHFPAHSPIVSLLHSILGTGTNTFAMEADKIPDLQKLMTDFEWRHVEAFPSVLRLLYDLPLRRELRSSIGKFDKLEQVSFHRVIDNQKLTMSAEDFWIQLNYQLIHLIDFLPAANWVTHASDTAFILFRDLYDLLNTGGKLMTALDYTPASGGRQSTGENPSIPAWLTTLIPVSVGEKLGAKSVRRFSEQINHSISYEMKWS